MRGNARTVLLANPGADLYGSDRMAVETTKALVGRGYRVVATVPGPGPLTALLEAAGAMVTECPTPVVRKALATPRGLLQLAHETVQAWRPGGRLLRESDARLVWVNTITVPLWILLARLAGRRVVCHVHEAERSVPWWVRRLLYAPTMLCHAIVVNSDFARRVLAGSTLGTNRRTRLVYNAVAGPATVRAARETLTPPTRLLYVGRLSHRKGPHVAIEAVRLLRNRGRLVHLTLVGAVFPGNESYEDSLRLYVSKAGIADSVRFAGFRDGVWDALGDSDVVLVPSTVDEPFGNTAVEALLAGRPLVVSDVGGLTEASQGASSRITVPPGEASAIASAIESIEGDWALYRERAHRDAAVMSARFSFDRYADEIVRVVEHALQRTERADSNDRSLRYQTPSTSTV